MTNGPNSLLGTINLKTVIELVTVAALVGGSFYVQGERIAANSKTLDELKTSITNLNNRLVTAERDNATMTVRMENLREMVIELRRQSGLRTEPLP